MAKAPIMHEPNVLLLEDFINPMAFFQGIHDAPELNLDANHTGARAKVRASALSSCAREQAYMLAGTPKSDPQRDDLNRVTQQYANEQGRQAEELSFTAIENQPGRKVKLMVVGRQREVPSKFPFTGHPDGELAWYYADEVWEDLPESVQAERRFFTAEMFGREGTVPFRVGVEHKDPGVNSFGNVLRGGVAGGKPEWLLQGTLYGEAFDWDYLLVITIALDATAVKSPKMGMLKLLNDMLHAKGHFELHDLRELRAAYYPRLKRRAVALNKFAASGADPAEVEREYSGSVGFPCGYCEWQSRCKLDGAGTVKMPEVPR